MTDEKGSFDPKPGDWVLVRARVDTKNKTHSEDIRLAMRSHSDHYVAHCLRSDVVGPTEPPGDWPRCAHATRQVVTVRENRAVEAILRCTRSDQHGGDHEADSALADGLVRWGNRETDIYVEEG